MAFAFEDLRGSKDARYGNGRHSDLPWGYWLVSKSEFPGRPPLVDEDGAEWGSVREAFWSGRLGLPYSRLAEQTMQFMANYMAIVDGRFVPQEECVRDIFQGDQHVSNLYRLFMDAAGLVCARDTRLTPEGRAVLLMLLATHGHNDAQDAVGMDWILCNRAVAGWKERISAAAQVERREEVASRMLHRFATDTIDGKPAVKLVGLHITKEIPVRSTLWTMTWEIGDRYARDRFYLWLLERIDRWDAWSEMAAKNGSRALTEHFMKLAFCDRFALEDQSDSGEVGS